MHQRAMRLKLLSVGYSKFFLAYVMYTVPYVQLRAPTAVFRMMCYGAIFRPRCVLCCRNGHSGVPGRASCLTGQEVVGCACTSASSFPV